MKTLLCACALLAAIASGWAQDGGRGSPLYGSQGVRVLGMGGAAAAWLDEPAALFWNPATLSLAPVRRLELQHARHAFDTRTEQAVLVNPTLDFGAWAVGGVLQTTGDIVITGSASPAPLGSESFHRFDLAAGYGQRAPLGVHLGGALKVVGYRFGGLERAAWGLNAGAALLSARRLKAGLAVHNLLAPSFSFGDGLEDVWPRQFSGGLAYAPGSRLTAALALDLAPRQDPRPRIGVEYQAVAPLALRAGHDGLGVTLGLGLTQGRFRLDYAFLAGSDLGSEHRFGLSFDLGIPLATQRRLRDARVDSRVADALARRDRDRERTLALAADSAYALQDWESAARSYAQLLLLAPENSRYRRRLTDLSTRRDSIVAGQVAQAVGAATGAERVAALRRAFAAQMQAGQWNAALALARTLSEDDRAASDSLLALAADSLQAATARAVRAGESALARGDAAAAAGWARVAQLYSSAESVERLLRRAEFLNATQRAEAALLEALAGEDTVAILTACQDLLTLIPQHALASRYLKVYTPGPTPEATAIAEIQKDREAWGWYTAGFEAFRQGRYAAAIEWWERVLERYPANEAARKNIEQARLRLAPAPGEGKR